MESAIWLSILSVLFALKLCVWVLLLVWWRHPHWREQEIRRAVSTYSYINHTPRRRGFDSRKTRGPADATCSAP